MTPAQLSDLLRELIARAFGLPLEVEIRRAAHDPRAWSTAVALRLQNPRGPSLLAEHLRADPRIADVQIAGPGFLNITVDGADLASLAVAIVDGDAPLAGDHADEARPEELDEVRFAHGRLCSLRAQAAAHGVTMDTFVPATLKDATDMALLTALAEAHDEPGHAQLILLADAFQAWYAATRLTPRGLDPVTDAHRTRLWLAEATRIVLATGLLQLGLTAPEHI